MSRKRISISLLAAALAATGSVAVAQAARDGGHGHRVGAGPSIMHGGTATPIKHVVVIFQENVSFDHYFGTYPNAANTDGQTFNAAPGTPSVNGLTESLLTNNPNKDSMGNQVNPQRLDSSPTGLAGGAGGQLTCDQNHDYTDEQTAFDGGLMDKFVTGVGTGSGKSPFGTPCNADTVMDYFDGNTVTALWNYAQHFAMSDNSYNSTFGPSTPGAINLVSGNTGAIDTSNNNAFLINGALTGAGTPNADLTPNGHGGYSLTSDAQPYYDDCSTRDAAAFTGPNIGDELNAAGLSWGWFQGGLRPSTSFTQALADIGASQPTSTFTPNEFKAFFAIASHRPLGSSNQALCSSVHPVGAALGGTITPTATGFKSTWGTKDDYIPHHEPFQYYASTANPHHLTIPTDASGNDTMAGLAEIGHDTQSYVGGQPQFDTPNHQYDTSDFDQLVAAISAGDLPPSALPAVSFVKAPGYQDGHGAYSDPADEQQFVVHVINELERSPDWHNTAVMINYDDSDGWYDHRYSGVTNPSASGADNLTGAGLCGTETSSFQPLGGDQGRCGFGPRLPFLVISPYAKRNAVDSNLSDQSSVLNFVEYNWALPGIPGSFDQALAGVDMSEGIPFDLAGMFNFGPARNHRLILDPNTGQPVGADHEQFGRRRGARNRSHRRR